MNSPIVLIIAMESERRHLDDLLPGWKKIESAVWPTLRNGDLITITCGIGMTLAAAATEHAISAYSPAMVLNYGCAGAHTRDLFPGDVVVGDRLVHHGRMRFTPEGRIVPMVQSFSVPGEITTVDFLESNRALADLTMQLTSEIELQVWPEVLRLTGQTDRRPDVRFGTVSSGDIWLQDSSLIDAGNQRTGSLCEDMEAAAIAQICAIHHTPFLTVKDISNSEFHAATVFDGTSSALPSNEVGLRAATLVAELIRRIGSIGDMSAVTYS